MFKNICWLCVHTHAHVHTREPSQEEVVRAAAPATHRSNSATSNLLATEECYLFTTDSTIYRRQFRKCYTVINKNYSKWSEESRSQAAWFNRSLVWKPLHGIGELLFLLCFNNSDFLVVKCSGVGAVSQYI